MRIAISVLFCMRVNFRNGAYARGKEIEFQKNRRILLRQPNKIQFQLSVEIIQVAAPSKSSESFSESELDGSVRGNDRGLFVFSPSESSSCSNMGRA
eukprot:COSAG01_NODE_30757_length_610_cov_0.757339_1_plen_97_part_00